MKKFIILTMVTMIFLLVFVAGGLAKPVDKINEKIEGVTLVLYNRCTEETVTTYGTIHINELSSGELHVKGHFASESYIVNITLNFKEYSLFPLLKGTGIIRITCISKGEAPNLILKAIGFEWDYSGSITINNFIEGTIDCVGK
jgi:hypothetical protein